MQIVYLLISQKNVFLSYINFGFPRIIYFLFIFNFLSNYQLFFLTCSTKKILYLEVLYFGRSDLSTTFLSWSHSFGLMSLPDVILGLSYRSQWERPLYYHIGNPPFCFSSRFPYFLCPLSSTSFLPSSTSSFSRKQLLLKEEKAGKFSVPECLNKSLFCLN